MIEVDTQQEANDMVQAMGCKDMETPELASYFVHRLARLVALRETYASQLDPAMARILRWAIFSTYLDLRELGMGDQALELISAGSRTLAEAGRPAA